MKKISRYFVILVALVISISTCSCLNLKKPIEVTTEAPDKESTGVVEETEASNNSIEQTESEEELELDWIDIKYEIDEYFPEIQEELKKGSNSFKDIPITISNERTLVLDGHDTNYSIDYITPINKLDNIGNYSFYVVEDSTWICYVDTVQEFFVPNRYRGDVYTASQTRADSLGNIYYEEMELPGMDFNELPKGYPYYMFTIENVQVYAPYRYKIIHYIEQFKFGESQSKYEIDLNNKKLFNSCQIVSFKDDKILLENDNILGVFNILTETFDIISFDMKDGKLVSVDQLLFTDSKHDLYLCSWTLNTEAIRVRDN